MNILGIHGSPRKNGNSDLLLDRCLEGARSRGAQVESIRACSLKILGCLACNKCRQTGQCVVDDDMQKVYPLLARAERIVMAAPVFFFGLPAQLKSLVDRVQACWSKRMLAKSAEERKTYSSGLGYLIAVGATRGDNLFEGCELTAKYFYDALDMEYRRGLFFRNIDAKGAILEHADAMQQAFDLGIRIANQL
ncbi:MAG: flavodoxin family protein [Deltaproteobacteria bacterium]|nr:flavodoxin family protein [Deltaproteobacteria bacterium]